MIAEIEGLEEMDTSEFHARRLNAKEVLTPKRSGNFIFPVADRTVKIFWRGQRLRTSTLIQERPERGEGQEILQGRSGELRSPTALHGDSTRDDEEAKSDFWTITEDFTYRHHVEPRVKLYVPREESFPIPMKYIDVTRTTHTSLDVMMEKYWWLLERRLRKRIIRSMDRFLKIHCIEWKTTGWIFIVRGETDKKTNDLQARHFVARDLERYVWCVETQRKAKVDYRETKARQRQKIVWYLLHWSWWWGIQGYQEKCTWKVGNSDANSNALQTWTWEVQGNLSRWKRIASLHCWGRWMYEKAHGRISPQVSWKSWIHWTNQSLLLCLVKLWKRIVGVVHPTKFRQNLRVFWKQIHPQECVWEIRYRIIMKTILQEKERIHYSTTT